MNTRRSFFKQLLMGAATFAILPPATTYERLWRAQRPYIEIVTDVDTFRQMLLNEVPRFEALIQKEYCDPWSFKTWESIDLSTA